MSKRLLSILICDDDKYFRMALSSEISSFGLIKEASNELEAIELIKDNHFDLALIDMDIDGPRSGLKILKSSKVKKIHSIILSSQNSEEIIEKAYEAGCDHFLSKTKYRDHLPQYVQKLRKLDTSDSIENFFKSKYITEDIELKQRVQELCKMNLKNKTVLLTGETGVGKSLIGELLHKQTFEDDAPFIHLNCSEVPENLIESELFGHEKGAFTGAIHAKKGKLELANGGTLFLDEIGTMPQSMQNKLLKALDQKTFYPVGAQKEVKSEFTLITATCEDLFGKIANNQFRKDLFFRVSGLNLDIKPLRYRKGDIPLLIKKFINESHRRFIIKDCAIKKLSFHEWPGNIRELKKQIDLLSTKEKGIIKASDIEFNSGVEYNKDTWITSDQMEFISKEGLRNFIKRVEEESLKQILEQNNGKITHTIKELRISASAFYRIFNNLNY